MSLGALGDSAVGYVKAFAGVSLSRLREARRRRDAGASAIELAIITAVLVGLAVVVLAIVTTIVNNRANEINSNNGKIP